MIRRCVAEFIGTFAIVFFGCGSIISLNGSGSATHLTVNLVFGLVVAAMIFALGPISAAHFNPAVTVGFAVAKRFPWTAVPAYVGSQIAGALAASAIHASILPQLATGAKFGSTISSLGQGQTVVVEAVLTFFLMLVIIAVAADKRVAAPVPGLAIGATVALCGLFGGPLTGCSMNPARSLAPAVFSGNLPELWLFVLGPLLGAAFAAVMFEGLRPEPQFAQSAPGDLGVN
ncbi:MAG: MIP/aquaporin family protein [Fimbriimonas sp.]